MTGCRRRRWSRAGVVLAAAGPLLAGCEREPAADAGPSDAVSGGPVPAASGPSSAPDPDPAPWFELDLDSGIDFVHQSGERGEYRIAASLCGGVALFDADGDGDLDAYFVQAGDHDDAAARPPNRLYRNDGHGRFTDITEWSGAGDTGYGMSVTAVDYDQDGDIDLYITNVGPNVLLRNDGNGRFTDVTAEAGVGTPGFSTGAIFLDFDGDGHLDLWVLQYLDWTDAFVARTCFNRLGAPDYCVPTSYDAPAADRLYRNDGNGRFTDVTREAGLLAHPGTGLGVVAADFDGDELVDVFVANDAMEDRLWINAGDGTFREMGLLAGVATNGQGRATASMGVAVRDLDDDGDLDLLVGNLAQESDSLFRNAGPGDGMGSFQDVANLAGLAAASRRFTRFGLGLHDFDHDGWLDLYHANGGVMRQERNHSESDPYAEPNVVFRGRPGGRFEELQPRGGTADLLVATSRGAAFGDIDGDGDIDVLIVNRDGPVHVLRNIAPKAGGFVQLDLREPDGRIAHGARILARVGDRSVRVDPGPTSGYFASHDPRAHLGLGDAPVAADVVVRWADGTREGFGDMPAGTQRRLVRGTGTPR